MTVQELEDVCRRIESALHPGEGGVSLQTREDMERIAEMHKNLRSYNRYEDAASTARVMFMREILFPLLFPNGK